VNQNNGWLRSVTEGDENGNNHPGRDTAPGKSARPTHPLPYFA